MDWINLFEEMDQRQAPENMVMKCSVQYNTGNVLTRWATVSWLRRTLLYGVIYLVMSVGWSVSKLANKCRTSSWVFAPYRSEQCCNVSEVHAATIFRVDPKMGAACTSPTLATATFTLQRSESRVNIYSEPLREPKISSVFVFMLVSQSASQWAI
jgi:hypothetical protein